MLPNMLDQLDRVMVKVYVQDFLQVSTSYAWFSHYFGVRLGNVGKLCLIESHPPHPDLKYLSKFLDGFIIFADVCNHIL